MYKARVLQKLWQVTAIVSMLLIGCAEHVVTARIPGCVPVVDVLVPKGCYANVMPDKSLEIRCADNTVSYQCAERK